MVCNGAKWGCAFTSVPLFDNCFISENVSKSPSHNPYCVICWTLLLICSSLSLCWSWRWWLLCCCLSRLLWTRCRVLLSVEIHWIFFRSYWLRYFFTEILLTSWTWNFNIFIWRYHLLELLLALVAEVLLLHKSVRDILILRLELEIVSVHWFDSWLWNVFQECKMIKLISGTLILY